VEPKTHNLGFGEFLASSIHKFWVKILGPDPGCPNLQPQITVIWGENSPYPKLIPFYTFMIISNAKHSTHFFKNWRETGRAEKFVPTIQHL